MAGKPSAAAFVSVDMEGCATLVHWDEVRPSQDPAYQRAREIMTDETNAVVDGIVSSGIGRVVVNDSHSTMRNIIADQLRPAATLVSGQMKPLYMLEGIEPGMRGAFFVGYHGAIGDRNAVMGHTYSPRTIYECRINGEPAGEVTINAALAGRYGVPVVFVSGDRRTIEEAHRRLPWAVGVPTKKSLSYYAAEVESPARVRGSLLEGARAAMASAPRCKPYVVQAPIVLEIDTTTTAHADAIALIPGCNRVAARSIAYSAGDFAAVYRALVAMILVGSGVAA